MNNQDLTLNEKIEKREKFDTILAYVLLVILTACLAFMLYIKYGREEKPKVPEEYVPNYISLNDISSSLNSSLLANKYLNDGASFNTSILESTLIVNYTKEDKNINMNIGSFNNELEVIINDENKDIATDIYKEIASIVCIYYGNQENQCRNTINNTTDNIEGIRFVNTENSNNVYIDITKSITINNIKVYDSSTITSISDTNYILNLNGNKITDIKINSSENNIVFSGNIERNNEETANLSILVKLYDNSNNLIGENKYQFNEDNVLNKIGSFEVSFMFNDSLKLENIVNYTIEVE